MSSLRVGFARWRSDVPSGGNRYDEELAAGLRDLGVDLREHPITGPWPTPEPVDRRRFETLLAEEQQWLVGNIVASAAPEAIAQAVAAGRRVTVVIHYFPADDPNLRKVDRDRLAETESRAVNAASVVVAASSWAAAEVGKRYGRDDVAVAVPGVEPAPLSDGSELLGRPPALLWLGRLSHGKDPLTFIDALERVRDLDWTARLVGPDTVDDALTREIRERIADAGLADRVALTGSLQGDRLEAAWSRTDLLVHTSRSEVYGMVVAEALARGIPSIVSSGTGAVEAQHGAGALFPPGDADALASAMRGWLTDARLRERWRSAASMQRAHLPTWKQTARAVLSALTQ